MAGKGRDKEFPDDLVSLLSLQVYRLQLGDPDRQLREDGDGGSRQARRASAYDNLTRKYLRVIRDNEEETKL